MRLIILILSIIVLAGCSATKSEESLRKLADELAHQYIITDGHVDLPYRLRVQNFRLEKEFIGIPIETDKGDFDYVRAKKGGLDAPFMSIYIPSKFQKEGGAKELADTLITMIEDICSAHPDKFGIAFTPDDVKKYFREGIISLPMGMENGAPIGDDLANLTYFRKRGISYITLTHSKDNQICDSSYDKKRTWNGLSPYGRKVVEEMNKVGIMIDISHVSDDAFYQTLEITKVPVIASHSSCRKYTPGFERNMSDDMIQKMKPNGGVIQINFGSTFLDSKIDEQNTELRHELDSMLKSQDLKHNDVEAKPIIEQFKKDNPKLFSDVEMVANHIDHVVALAGIDHVGLGSDYDGVGDSLPTGLKDVSQYPNLIYVLLQRGYSKEDIEKICYKNVFRVWQQVLDYAN
ncbi:MAG: dipeptidase [Saprospiraceae bacterium]